MKNNNFLEFIVEDIDAKKELIASLPINDNQEIGLYNQKLDDIKLKYNEYKKAVITFMMAKRDAFEIPINDQNIEHLKERITVLEEAYLYTNPQSRIFDKMGFGDLFYRIEHYGDFDFQALNKIIDEFVEKFSSAGIALKASDFNCSYYVNEYMKCYFKSKKTTGDELSKMFEKIYWVNPQLMEHIAYNFSLLIKANKKSFMNNVAKLQRRALQKAKAHGYSDVAHKLSKAYDELNVMGQENISIIIDKAINNKLEIVNYLDSSKVKTDTFNELIMSNVDMTDEAMANKVYDALFKLKLNVKEYIKYCDYIKLIDQFKKEFQDLIKSGKHESKVKTIRVTIKELQKKLTKINKKIFKTTGLFKASDDLKDKYKKQSLLILDEITKAYQELRREKLNDLIVSKFNLEVTVSDVLHMYYSLDYVKKNSLRLIYNNEINYDDLMKICTKFDSFAINPSNLVINNIKVFDDQKINELLIKNYRMNNINLNDGNFNVDSLRELLNKVILILRTRVIDKSDFNAEQIWFMAQVEKIKNNETIN